MMFDKLKSLDRDNIHFVIIGSALIFGLATAVVGHIHPPAAATPVLYWWPTSYTPVWFGFCGVLMVLLLLGRSQVLASKIPFYFLWISLAALAAIIAALWVVTLCRVSVFQDRLESQTLTMHGFERATYRLDDVKAVQFGCKVGSQRGVDSSELTYQLVFPQDDTIDLAKGRNDSRDQGMWLGAVVMADQALMARGVPKSDVRASLGQIIDLSDCMDQVKKERTPEETATIERIFKASAAVSQKKLKAARPVA